jgi:hypothetical protein
MSEAGLSAQEFAEIQNLYAKYNICSDAGDAEGFARCFAKDGVLRIDSVGLRVAGHAEFVRFKEKDRDGRGGRYRRHWNGSLHLERLAGGKVRGRCYLLAYNGDPGKLPVLADCGVYEDTLVLEAGAWRFLERSLSLDAGSWKKPQA